MTQQPSQRKEDMFCEVCNPCTCTGKEIKEPETFHCFVCNPKGHVAHMTYGHVITWYNAKQKWSKEKYDKAMKAHFSIPQDFEWEQDNAKQIVEEVRRRQKEAGYR